MYLGIEWYKWLFYSLLAIHFMIGFVYHIWPGHKADPDESFGKTVMMAMVWGIVWSLVLTAIWFDNRQRRKQEHRQAAQGGAR